ncbi:MAG: DNRLRE domain-containing protein [Mycobacteriales bacterium]
MSRVLVTALIAVPVAAVTLTAGPGASTPRAEAAAGATTTFDATQDTQLNSAAPNTTYGGAVKMAVCGNGAAVCSVDKADEKRGLVKFVVAGTAGTVSSAVLRYYAASQPVPALMVRQVTDSWDATTATWNNSKDLATAPPTYSSPAGSAKGYYAADVTGAVTGDGTYSFSILSASATTLRLATRESTAPVATPQLVVTTTSTTPADPVIVAAGDISTRTKVGGNKLTSDLVLSLNPDKVLTLGDDQYPDGALADYNTYYNPTWGRFKTKTAPVVGNHEYLADTTASGYFSYFGTAASPTETACTADCKGYYSFDVGAWHVVVLNTNHNDCLYVACSAGSPQLSWLQQDLATSTKTCIAAAFHHPRWSSGISHGSDPAMAAIWNELYAANVDVVLNGHEHQYERFAKQDPSGTAAANGMREFVVGTGGNGLYGFGTPVANSEVRNNTSKGVLKLTLHASSYDWAFVPAQGFTFTDAGTNTCNS